MRKSFVLLSALFIFWMLASCKSEPAGGVPAGADNSSQSPAAITDQSPAVSTDQPSASATRQSPDAETNQSPAAVADDVTADIIQSEMWHVELLRAELADSLTATQAAVQYGGGILETTSEITPGSGNTFLLLNLTVEKIGTGRASFTWSDAHVEDADGNVYFRHPNDTFLANLKIPRLKGTDIVFGIESGFVCFEIPKGVVGLCFVADDGAISINIVTE